MNGKRILGDECGISTDTIVGFCGETEEEHQDTLSLMQEVKFDYAYMYAYSERPNTPAAKKFKDDVPEEIKKRRLQEVIDLQRINALESNKRNVGKTYKVLIEGFSKRSDNFLQGRTSENKMVVFAKGNAQKGEYVDVLINDCTSATLIGTIV